LKGTPYHSSTIVSGDGEMASSFISVVIPVRNSEKTLDRCLDSIFSCNYPPNQFEVIVVDHESTDDSAKIAGSYPVTVIRKRGGTISSVRNFGAAMAKGKYIACIDSDCLIAEDWLAEASAVFEGSKVGVAGSGYLAPESASWVEKAWLYERKQGAFVTDFLPGGNMMIRRDVFCEINGFNDDLATGEDSDLCLRVSRRGYQVVNSARIRCVHLGNSKTIRQFARKEFWYGQDMVKDLRVVCFDRTFFVTLAYIALANMTLSGLLLDAAGKPNREAVVGAAGMVAIALCCSYYRCYNSRKYRYFFHTAFLYIIYFGSRSCAVLNSAAKSAGRRVETTAGTRQ
jgi:glycosyltransferase involved in cell wall biosynthesis